MTNAWTDFNDVKQTSNLIPKGTIVKVRMTLRPGGFDDPSQGWTGGYAKRGPVPNARSARWFNCVRAPACFWRTICGAKPATTASPTTSR